MSNSTLLLLALGLFIWHEGEKKKAALRAASDQQAAQARAAERARESDLLNEGVDVVTTAAGKIWDFFEGEDPTQVVEEPSTDATVYA